VQCKAFLIVNLNKIVSEMQVLSREEYLAALVEEDAWEPSGPLRGEADKSTIN
jgi:hypothetical protein